MTMRVWTDKELQLLEILQTQAIDTAIKLLSCRPEGFKFDMHEPLLVFMGKSSITKL